MADTRLNNQVCRLSAPLLMASNMNNSKLASDASLLLRQI
jgi:hypothetical protein